MHKSFLLVAALSLISCEEESTPHKYEVQYYGAMKNMMMEGDLTATATLTEFEAVENLYALGAMEDLKGEIQIFNSKAMNSIVQNDSVKIDTSYDYKSALFVFAQVPSWKRVNIPDTVTTAQSLENFIARAAGENEQDMEEPFPFLLEGEVSSLEWHVIDWKEGDSIHTPQKHRESGLQGTLSEEQVAVVGFYSRSHHRIFTHHSSNVHMHFKNEDESLAGHIDELSPKKMTLLLPGAP
ncbi:decarboxylase [Antarcticibacterium flavum]|uniref:Decarboxylase n=1 Tax=Antarcticibacterium flavum TaxID=2058175 RepID=A0A5B7X3Z3_9FLAO|nr:MULTISPECIES: acetolactate decarboxylase [Antarcticibacterium]MCM4159059.1 decarboxylase [Antarcticibacterium sp. W02-3]QCY69462.1 decarboxylase [Antarcticibacterium flavum]